MPACQSLLIVDDSHAERQLMSQILRSGFPEAEILSASHPHLALSMCEERGFDCVLMDYNMPDLDGLMLARELKAAHAHLAIVLMTSVGDEMLASEALRSGISDYIPKSRINTQVLHRIVSRSIHACGQAKMIDEQREELETFAYALAHDFKQPIRQITTFSNLISEAASEQDDEELRQHLAFLSDAARRLGKLVDVMSQYTLLNQPPELEPVDLGKVFESVRSWLSPYITERNGEVAVPKTAPEVMGNEVLLGQVIENLIVNGLRYNESSKPKIEISVRAEEAHWVIAVRDNGLGISERFLKEIFRPLVRLHNASDYPGSGLGLTLARKAVVVQKGAIWCDSRPGRGSVFHVRLPAVATAPSSAKAGRPAKRSARPPILTH